MALESNDIEKMFHHLGEKLREPTTLCIFGSTPSILLGQPERQTQDIDVWHPQSIYDAGDLSQACSQIGVLYNPTQEIDPSLIYLQIVRPGVVDLPNKFTTETIGRYGKLTIIMPAADVLSAAKLIRGSENDVNDIVWWVQQRRISMEQMKQAISTFPNTIDQEVARDNLLYVKLVAGNL